MIKGLNQVKKYFGQFDTFTANVWHSGAYMRLAEALRADQPARAREYLKAAKKIIASGPRLIMRKKQLGILSKKFQTL